MIISAWKAIDSQNIYVPFFNKLKALGDFIASDFY